MAAAEEKRDVRDDGPTLVLDTGKAKLWLGDRADAIDDEVRKRCGFTVVITVAECSLSEDRIIALDWYRFVSIADRPQHAGQMGKHLRNTRQWIALQLALGRSVLVHCEEGKSRSVTVVADYLMYRNGWTGECTLDHIRAKRPFISVNRGFHKLLCQHDAQKRAAAEASAASSAKDVLP